MRPVRSLQIPPEVGKCPTDFTDLHRFFHRSFLSHRFHRFTQIFLGTFFCHADFADDADFFHHRVIRNLFGDFLLWRLLTDFRRCDLSGRCRYPLRLDKEIQQRFHKKSVYICEICGTKPFPRRKICVISEICVTKKQEHI